MLALRNALIFLCGIYALGRCSEIHALTVDAIARTELGMEITLNRGKTDARLVEQKHLIPFLIKDINTAPWWDAYLAAIPASGALWRRVTDPEQRDLAYCSVEEVTKEVASALGLEDSERYTFHGLRACGATLMASHCTDLELMQAGNWKSMNVAREYIRRTKKAMIKRAAQISGAATVEPPPKQQKSENAAPQAPPPQAIPPQAAPMFSGCQFTNCTFQLHPQILDGI
jgi:integrase